MNNHGNDAAEKTGCGKTSTVSSSFRPNPKFDEGSVPLRSGFDPSRLRICVKIEAKLN